MKLLVLLTILLFVPNVYAGEPSLEQKKRWGLTKDKKMTTCRLAARKVYSDKKFCIYKGANKTYEQLVVPTFEVCPSQFKCVYSPRDDDSVKSIIEKLERNWK